MAPPLARRRGEWTSKLPTRTSTVYKRIGLGVNKNLKATFPTYFSAVNPGKKASMALAASAASAVLLPRRRHRRRYEAWQAALRLSRAARHDHLEAAYDEVHHDHLEAA